MYQAVTARRQRNESTKVHDLDNFTFKDLTRFDISGNLLDTLTGLIAGFLVNAADGDGAVIGDVDGG